MLKMQELREIIQLIDESSINEFTYETEGSKVKLTKAYNEPVVKQQVTTAQTVEAQGQDAAQIIEDTTEPSQGQATPPTQEAIADYDFEITSPMVGTFYRASSPENDPFVQAGSKITDTTVVCIVEAMKLFNEIEAEITGEITEILVEDSELVEYGQPLFRVKK